jgi:hypothetical protein
MLETLKSVAFVLITVMIALILQAHAAKLSPDTIETVTADDQLQVYN